MSAVSLRAEGGVLHGDPAVALGHLNVGNVKGRFDGLPNVKHQLCDEVVSK